VPSGVAAGTVGAAMVALVVASGSGAAAVAAAEDAAVEFDGCETGEGGDADGEEAAAAGVQLVL